MPFLHLAMAPQQGTAMASGADGRTGPLCLWSQLQHPWGLSFLNCDVGRWHQTIIKWKQPTVPLRECHRACLLAFHGESVLQLGSGVSGTHKSQPQQGFSEPFKSLMQTGSLQRTMTIFLPANQSQHRVADNGGRHWDNKDRMRH